MKRFARFGSFICLLALVLSLFGGISPVRADEEALIRQDTWSLETLLSLGAELPTYHADGNYYEIATPEQLLYLSGVWKPEDTNKDGAPDAPCNGKYVLTADLDMKPLMERIGAEISREISAETKGYMPPIAANADEGEEGGVNCAFFGEFDGQNHVIRNLAVRKTGYKYCGLFGNIGHDYGTGSAHDLAILDADIYGLSSAGILAGSIYGDVWNIVCTGKVTVEQKNAGGLTAKIKRNENGYLGTAKDCLIAADIHVLGLEGENGAAGLVAASCSKGGQIFNCFATGSIVVDGVEADTVGGIVGNLKGGLAIDNCVMLASEITATGTDSQNFGLLLGSFAGDTGSHIHNNYVWEGTALFGKPASDHPESAAYTEITAEKARSKAFYTEKSGWDFEQVWTWSGKEEGGYPMLAAFSDDLDLSDTLDRYLAVTKPVLHGSEPLTNTVYAGDPAPIRASVLLPEGTSVTGGTLFYGTGKDREDFNNSVEMSVDGRTVSVDLTFEKTGKYNYYYTVDAGGETLSFPTEGTLLLTVKDPSERFKPMQETISPGKDFSSVGVNWITEAEGLTGEVRLRKTGSKQWETSFPAETYVAQVGNDHGRFASFSADLTGLEPATGYDYMAVTNDGQKDYFGTVHSFTTLPDGKDFSFIVISDLQGTNEEDYLPYYWTDSTFLTDTIHPNFVINLGDLTEDDTMAEWSYLFNTIGSVLASRLTAYVPGNHEFKGDLVYTHFAGRTNLPGGMDDETIGETTGCFVAGDVCFVTINTDPHTGIDGADADADKRMYYEKQMAWAKEMFEASGCKFRVLAGHAGLVQKDDVATAYLEKMCNELHVDLFFNGHIHNYFRATVDAEGKHAETGKATTFITSSPMGTKFDDYGGEIDDILDIQTGGSGDPRQYLTYVEVHEGTLTVTAYQRVTAQEPSKKTCNEYEVIEQFVLTAKEDMPPETEAVETTPAVTDAPSEAPTEAPEPGAPSGPSPVLWIVLGSIAALALLALAVILIRKNAKKNET